MLDKLSLTTPAFIHPDLIERSLKGLVANRSALPSDHGYERCDLYFRRLPSGKHEQFLALHTGPIFGQAQSKLELNPSKFASFRELKGVIGSFADTAALRVTRLDTAVDLDVSMMLVDACLRFPRKTRITRYDRRGVKTVRVGLGDERIHFYLKKGEPPLTRVEVQHFRRRVRVGFFDGLPEIVAHDPFSGLKTERLVEGKFDQHKQAIFAILISQHGLHLARQFLNPQRNFDRDFGHFLEPEGLVERMRELNQRDLAQFFETDARLQENTTPLLARGNDATE